MRHRLCEVVVGKGWWCTYRLTAYKVKLGVQIPAILHWWWEFWNISHVLGPEGTIATQCYWKLALCYSKPQLEETNDFVIISVIYWGSCFCFWGIRLHYRNSRANFGAGIKWIFHLFAKSYLKALSMNDWINRFVLNNAIIIYSYCSLTTYINSSLFLLWL